MKFKLIIGLGNPGQKYRGTYHNVGHMAADYLKPLNSKSYILNSDVYMNEAGRFVKAALKKTNTKPAELLVVHDDSDIALGHYKLAFGRGPAGHKGVASVIKALGTKDFWRLRIGIRPASERQRRPAGAFVLKSINQRDKKNLEQVFKKAKAELKI